MKILLLIDAWFPFIGGAQVQIKNLKQILEKKHQCKFFILHSSSSNIIMRFFWSFYVIPQAILLHKKYSFVLIHAHAYWSGIPGKILSKILKLPIIYTVHGSNLMDLKVKSIRAVLEKWILTGIKYNQVISVSSNFLKYKNVNENIQVIPNGVDIRQFDNLVVKKDKNYKILFVGRNDSIKGFRYLKEAMGMVRRIIPNVYLRIINNKFGSELIKEYKSSHLFVLPSLAEGQPIVLLEAWAAKLPVIVTNVGDNPKMVINGQNGLILSSRSSEALVNAISKILNDYQRAKLMGERGYQLVKEKYSWDSAAEKTYRCYKKLLEKNIS